MMFDQRTEIEKVWPKKLVELRFATLETLPPDYVVELPYVSIWSSVSKKVR